MSFHLLKPICISYVPLKILSATKAKNFLDLSELLPLVFKSRLPLKLQRTSLLLLLEIEVAAKPVEFVASAATGTSVRRTPAKVDDASEPVASERRVSRAQASVLEASRVQRFNLLDKIKPIFPHLIIRHRQRFWIGLLPHGILASGKKVGRTSLGCLARHTRRASCLRS